MTEPLDPNPVNGELAVREYFDSKTRRYLKRVITPELIEEHRRDPHAQHRSEALGRLMFYFKNLPIDQQYALRLMPDGRYRITDFPRPGHPPVAVDGADYADAAAGLHGIFLRKINDLMGRHDG